MEMTAFNDKDCLCVKLGGEIDHHEAKDIRERIDGLIMEHRPKSLVMHLGDINFMDSSGLGLILGRYRTIKSLGGELYLAKPNERVKKILAMAGADKFIKVL